MPLTPLPHTPRHQKPPIRSLLLSAFALAVFFTVVVSTVQLFVLPRPHVTPTSYLETLKHISSDANLRQQALSKGTPNPAPLPPAQQPLGGDMITENGEQIVAVKELAGQPPPGALSAEKEVERLFMLRTIIIFSKTYCPYSQRAKRLMTVKYHLTPPPYILELDQHVFGKEIQEVLRKKTGRATVPNIVVAGESIGGCDEVEKLHNENKLVERLRQAGSERLLGIMVLKEN